MPSRLEWLESLSPWPEEFGLGRMHALLEEVGEPQRAFRAIHHLAQPFGSRRRHNHSVLHGARLPDEAKALAVKRFDELLRPPIVAQCLACRLHAARDCGVGYDPAVPHLFHDLVPRDQALAVLDEQCEQREHLRLDVNGRAVRAQLGRGEIKLELAEGVDHPRLG